MGRRSPRRFRTGSVTAVERSRLRLPGRWRCSFRRRAHRGSRRSRRACGRRSSRICGRATPSPMSPPPPKRCCWRSLASAAALRFAISPWTSSRSRRPRSTRVSSEGTEALAILCVRGHPLSAKAIASIGSGLASKAVPLRRGSAYALSRCAGPSAERLAGSERGTLIERLSAMVTSTEPGEALAAWRALEALGEPPASVPASILGREPPGWQEEVAAVRALGASAVGRKELAQRLAGLTPWDLEGPRIPRAGGGGTRHATRDGRIARAARLVVAPGRPRRRRPRRDHGRAPQEGDRARALRADGARRFAHRTARSRAYLCRWCFPGCPSTTGPCSRWMPCSRAVRRCPGESRIDQILAAAASAIDGARRRGCARRPGGSRRRPRQRPAPKRDELRRRRPGFRGCRCDSGRVPSIRASATPDAVPALQGALARLTNDAAVEARIEVVRALGALARRQRHQGRRPAGASALARRHRGPRHRFQPGRPRRRPLGALRLGGSRHPPSMPRRRTNPAAGFSQRVHDAAAQGADANGLVLPHVGRRRHDSTSPAHPPRSPRPVSSVLAGNGYIVDGLTFHRIVPAFVVQGGDPRGDGYGGPGYVMPCEWSNLRYERGTVGHRPRGQGHRRLADLHQPRRAAPSRRTLPGDRARGRRHGCRRLAAAARSESSRSRSATSSAANALDVDRVEVLERLELGHAGMGHHPCGRGSIARGWSASAGWGSPHR